MFVIILLQKSFIAVYCNLINQVFIQTHVNETKITNVICFEFFAD